jgi:hypothetical protein
MGEKEEADKDEGEGVFTWKSQKISDSASKFRVSTVRRAACDTVKSADSEDAARGDRS